MVVQRYNVERYSLGAPSGTLRRRARLRCPAPRGQKPAASESAAAAAAAPCSTRSSGAGSAPSRCTCVGGREGGSGRGGGLRGGGLNGSAQGGAAPPRASFLPVTWTPVLPENLGTGDDPRRAFRVAATATLNGVNVLLTPFATRGSSTDRHGVERSGNGRASDQQARPALPKRRASRRLAPRAGARGQKLSRLLRNPSLAARN